MNDEIRQLRCDTDAAVQQSAALRAGLQWSVYRLARQVDECSASQQALKESVDQSKQSWKKRYKSPPANPNRKEVFNHISITKNGISPWLCHRQD